MTSRKKPGLSSVEKQSAARSPCAISASWNSKSAEPLISIWRSQIGDDTAYLPPTLITYMVKRCRWLLHQGSAPKWICHAHGSGQLALLPT